MGSERRRHAAKIVKDSYGIKVHLILWDLTLYGCDTAAGILKLY